MFPLNVVFLPLFTCSLCCSLELWLCCVWAWTSSSFSSTRSGFAAGGARVMIPHTPIHTPSSPVPTAAALLGASSSPHWSAGESLRLFFTAGTNGEQMGHFREACTCHLCFHHWHFSCRTSFGYRCY